MASKRVPETSGLLAAPPSGESAPRSGWIRRAWEWWLDRCYGKERCDFGMRRGAHDWFYLNCTGCRDRWVEEVEEDAVKCANRRAAREREERVSQMVEALHRFSAEGGQLPMAPARGPDGTRASNQKEGN